MATLKDNVKRMMEAGVPEEEIGNYIKQYQEPEGPAQPPTPTPQEAPAEGNATFADLPSNITPSAVEYVKNLGSAIANPIETLTGIYHMAKGSGVPLPGGMSLIPQTPEDRAAFMGLANTMRERYGSPEAMKQTMVKDPVGFLADAAGVVSGVGGAVRGVGTGARAAQIGRGIQRAGEIMDPLNIARQTAALPARAIGATGLPQRMYTGVVKPTKRIGRPEREAMFDLAAREGIVPKEGGRGLLGRGRGGLETVGELKTSKIDEINQAISDAEKAGERVYTDTALSEAIGTVERDWSRPQRSIASRQVQEYMADLPEVMTPSRAQKVKVDIGQELGETAYGKQQLGRKAVQKDFRRGLKDELERIHPELKQLNQEYAEIKNLNAAIDDAVKRIQNRNLIGVTEGLEVAVSPLFAIKAALGIPQVKSRLAIALARARKVPNIGTGGPATRALLTNIERSEEYGR